MQGRLVEDSGIQYKMGTTNRNFLSLKYVLLFEYMFISRFLFGVFGVRIECVACRVLVGLGSSSDPGEATYLEGIVTIALFGFFPCFIRLL